MTEKLVKRCLASEERHDRVGEEARRFVGSIVEVGGGGSVNIRPHRALVGERDLLLDLNGSVRFQAPPPPEVVVEVEVVVVARE